MDGGAAQRQTGTGRRQHPHQPISQRRTIDEVGLSPAIWCAANRAVSGNISAAGAGLGESTTDVVFGGHSLIAENGSLLAETERFRFDPIRHRRIDLQRLAHERWTNTSFSAAGQLNDFRRIQFQLAEREDEKTSESQIEKLYRVVPRMPFVPSDLTQRAKHAGDLCHSGNRLDEAGVTPQHKRSRLVSPAGWIPHWHCSSPSVPSTAWG